MGNVHGAVQSIVGVQYTLIAAAMISASLIPQGAIFLNPKMLYGETLNTEAGIDTNPEAVIVVCKDSPKQAAGEELEANIEGAVYKS